MKQIRLPKDVAFIIEKLNQAGYEAYAVGGCIRDTLLNRDPGDWDITTSASPWEVKRIFQRTIDTGLQHGTVTVMLHHIGYEVTTYRIDGEYEDGRHPKRVVFTKNLIEDLKRRDFTINAMAYNEKSGIVDEFNGILDLEKKVIRCVGNPEDRFAEDALRMLRAVRFAAQLGFTIEAETENAIQKLADTLEKISRERIQVELSKLLLSTHPECICKVYETGLSLWALPKTETFYIEETRNRIAKIVNYLPANAILRWAGFLSFCTEPSEGERILKGLKFDNHTIEYVKKLLYYLPQETEPEERKIRYAIYEMGEEIYPLYLILKRAELLAEMEIEKIKKRKEEERKEEKKGEKEKKREEERQQKEKMQEQKKDFSWKEKQKRLEETESLYRLIIERGDCISLKKLAVTGKDLLEEGILAGKELGRILNRLLYRVLDDPTENEKDKLLAIVREVRKG